MSSDDQLSNLENSIGHIPEGLLKDAMNSALPMQGFPRGPESMNGSPMSSLTKPYLEIVEQPKSRGFRFRYDCEGQSHGGLPGENSERNRKQKTYPTVRLVGYRGRSRIMVSLISDTDPPVPHAHSIVGKNAHDGRCIVEIGPETDMYAQFPNLGILHVTKKKVPEVLTQRLIQQVEMKNKSLEEIDTDKPTSVTEEDIAQIKQEAQQYAKTMNLSVVRLCFQAFLLDEHGRFTIAVEPVFTHKVYDSKAPSAGTLKICRLDKTSGTVRGGDDVFLLCDKVQKNDIEVLFYEEKHDSGMHPVQPWSSKGRFGPNDVHHQYAIVFQTPPFYNLAIERPVQVWISLRRPSDQELSDPKPFLYLPQEFDEERIGMKRKKKLQHFGNFFGDGGAAGGLGGNFFKGLGDLGGFGGSFSGFFGGSGGSGGGGGGGSQGYSGGGTTNAASMPSFELPGFDFEHSHPSNSFSADMHSLSISGPSYHSSEQQPFLYSSGGSTFGQQSMPPYRPQAQHIHSYPQQPSYSTNAPYPGLHPYPQLQQVYPRGGPSSGAPGRLSPSIIGSGGIQPKLEKMDPGYGDQVEMDGSRPRTPPGAMPHAPHGPQGKTLGVPDTEAEESGFAEIDSGLPKEGDTRADQQAEIEAQAAMQALRDRQQSAFQVCERMFNALLAWATTRDVRYLLAAQRSLTAVQNQEGDTALHLAIIHNHQDVVLQLLDVLPQLPPTETPVVDCLNNFKQSPLHLAVLTRQHKVIQYLLKANANPLVCDRDGNTPLHLACRMGFVEGAVTLLNRTNHINAEGCRIPEISVRNSSGQTPLHLAATCGSVEVMKLLVNAKADVNVQDSKSGKTALHQAIEKGDLPMGGYLVTETDADVNSCDFSGNTPLHVSSGLGRGAIVSLLLAAGSNLGVQNAEGESPLLLAEYGKHDEVAKLLRQAMEQAGVAQQEVATEQLAQEMESVSIKTEGDLANLDFRARIAVAMLLDPKRDCGDWRELCKHLDLETFLPGFQMMTSPTKEVLALYEAYDGTITDLRQALTNMGRTDAVNIIDRYLMENQSDLSSLSFLSGRSGKPIPHPRARTAPVFSTENVIPRVMMDSGLGSQSGSEDLGTQFGTQLPPTTAGDTTFQTLATTHA